MVTCDECGVKVNSSGYLGGGIVCHECAHAKRVGDDETLNRRRDRYGGATDD